MSKRTITVTVDLSRYEAMRAKIPAMVDDAVDDVVREPNRPPCSLPPDDEIIAGKFVTEIVPITAEWWTAFLARMDEVRAQRIGREFAAAFSDAADTLAVFSFAASDALKVAYKMKSRRRGLPLERGVRERRLKDGRR